MHGDPRCFRRSPQLLDLTSSHSVSTLPPWEICLLAVPAIVFMAAVNQTQVAKGIANQQAMVAMGFRELGTLEQVSREISQRLAGLWTDVDRS